MGRREIPSLPAPRAPHPLAKKGQTRRAASEKPAAKYIRRMGSVRPILSEKRRAPANRATLIAKIAQGARLALVRSRGILSLATGLSNFKNPTQNDHDQGVQLEKASTGTAQSAPIHAFTVITNPALACLQVPAMTYAG